MKKAAPSHEGLLDILKIAWSTIMTKPNSVFLEAFVSMNI